MGRFQNSIALAKSSWQVLRDDTQLVVLPILSLVTTLVVAFAVLLPVQRRFQVLEQGGLRVITSCRLPGEPAYLHEVIWRFDAASADFQNIARRVASVDTLDSFLRDMKTRFPDASAPATPAPPNAATGERASGANSGHESQRGIGGSSDFSGTTLRQ